MFCFIASYSVSCIFYSIFNPASGCQNDNKCVYNEVGPKGQPTSEAGYQELRHSASAACALCAVFSRMSITAARWHATTVWNVNRNNNYVTHSTKHRHSTFSI